MSASVHAYTVFQEPMPAPRQSSSDRWKKRPSIVRYHAWRDALKNDLFRQGFRRVPLADTRRLDVLAFFPVPKSRSRDWLGRHRGQLMRKGCDVDNVYKAVVDAIFYRDRREKKRSRTYLDDEQFAREYPDDRIIGAGACECRWADMLGPRMIIRIWTSQDDEPPSLFDYDPQAPECRWSLGRLAQKGGE